MKIIDIITSVILTICSAAGIFYSNGLRGDAGVLPRIVFVGLLICAIALLVTSFTKTHEQAESTGTDWKRLGISAGVALVYLILIPILGFYLATFLYLVATMFVFGVKSWKILVAVPVIFNIVIYLAFEKLLTIFLPAPFFL